MEGEEERGVEGRLLGVNAEARGRNGRGEGG